MSATRLQKFTRQIACIGALGMMATVSCGANNAGIALLIQNINAGTIRLEVTPFVGDKMLPREDFKDIQGAADYVAGFQLPRAYVGQSVSFQVNAINSNECIAQTVTTDKVNTDSLRRYDVNAKLQTYGGDPVEGNIFDIHGSSGNNVWVVSDNRGVSRWNGCYWRSVPVPTEFPSFIKIYVPPSTTPNGSAYAVSVDKIYRYDGTNWSLDYDPKFASLPVEVSMVFAGISGSSESDIWAVAGNKLALSATQNNSVILRRNTTGWVNDASGGLPAVAENKINAIHIINKTTVLVTGMSKMSEWFAARWTVGTWRLDQLSPRVSANTAVSIWGTSYDDYWLGGTPAVIKQIQQSATISKPEYDMIFGGGTGVNPNWRTARISGVASDDFWVLAFTPIPMIESKIIRYVGGQWKVQTELNNIAQQLTTFYVAGKDDVWFAGYGGMRIHYDGKTFTRATDKK